METIDELNAFVSKASQHNIRGKLINRGEARAIIRRDGVLPDDAPSFARSLDTDLAEYGFSLLRACLTLREARGESTVWSKGFLSVGHAFEALVRNGSQVVSQRGFWRVLGASAYHLAGYSAMAFSLMKQREAESNFAPGELAIVRLILRDLENLRSDVKTWMRAGTHLDGAVQAGLKNREMDTEVALSEILNTSLFRAISHFEFALLNGSVASHREARMILECGTRIASYTGSVTFWWIFRVASNLIDDLWSTSLHCTLPSVGPVGANNYDELRELYISSLYSRKVSEIELCPSQLEPARRAIDLCDDLVVSMPTSAGKTRIAEICALMSLSTGKRVLIVTPLRALSAQTERSFRKTFSPLGFSVSSLYGASGMIPEDDDTLRERDIVIATPEKLDFALRNDSSLIDDVGLIVLDEGHLIGPSERELRFEILVQRLLCRHDADIRRIICLSAILPEGEQLNDLTNWIRSDAEGIPVKLDWKPTRQRFGTLKWTGNAARLQFDAMNDGPFIQRFIMQSPAIPPRRTPFPKNNIELTFAAAWEFAKEGKKNLIYCTQRNHVESYAGKIVDLFDRGFLTNLLVDPNSIERAISIGKEWLGAEHPAVKCLNIGVAIHHARLPSPFLREIEQLLNKGVLTVTVSSPTLAQGLNLNAAVLLIPNLHRAGTRITGEEFANVVGRAFVDLEGLVIHVMYNRLNWRFQNWRNLVNESKERSLLSGLIQVTHLILQRLSRGRILDRADAYEYLVNSRDSWEITDNEQDEEPLEYLLEKLDNSILGLIEALDADSADLPRLIDEALNGSLWERQIARISDEIRKLQLFIIKARSELIWSKTTIQQRRGHFAMGLGLVSGLRLDEFADELAVSLDRADSAASRGDVYLLQEELTTLAERLLTITPFAPDDGQLPDNLQGILTDWLSGTPIRDIGPDNLQFIEEILVYRLVWAHEALRMRRIALGWQPEIIAGSAAACLETGLPKFLMAMLVRAGLSSRIAAKAIVNDQNPSFVNYSGMIDWLNSDEIAALSDDENWPTTSTAEIWRQFRSQMLAPTIKKWKKRE